MKFAFFVEPHAGGTYSLFRYLKPGLAAQGIDVEWMSVADEAISSLASHTDLQMGGFVKAPAAATEKTKAQALLNALVAGQYAGVFVNVLADRVQMNIARYLPDNFLRIMVVHSISPGTYAAAHAIRDHVHATVGVSERCRADLVGRFGFPAELTRAIPNAVDVTALSKAQRSPSTENLLRVLFLGRVEDTAKGVFWLPHIMRELPETVRLTVAGNGPDLLDLKRRFRSDPRTRFLGTVASADLPMVLSKHDVLIMPSRFEGFGLSLVEAMAAGCVPVASRIAGVTDAIVEHDNTGFLFPVGNWRQAARHIQLFADRPDLLAAMSERARQRASQMFDAGSMAASYAKLITALRANPPQIARPLLIEGWRYPSGMRSGLRTFLPVPIKNLLREARERLRGSAEAV